MGGEGRGLNTVSDGTRAAVRARGTSQRHFLQGTQRDFGSWWPLREGLKGEAATWSYVCSLSAGVGAGRAGTPPSVGPRATASFNTQVLFQKSGTRGARGSRQSARSARRPPQGLWAVQGAVPGCGAALQQGR